MREYDCQQRREDRRQAQIAGAMLVVLCAIVVSSLITSLAWWLA